MRSFRFALLGASAGCALLAVDARAQTLEEALAAAYINNPQLQAQRARVRVTDEGVPQALSGWRPTVQLNGSIGFAQSETNGSTSFATPNGTRTFDPKNYSVSITQPLYRGGRTVAGTQQAVNLVQAERARLAATEELVLLNGVTAFMNVVRDQATLDLNKNNEQVLRRQLEAARDRFRVGEITRTDVAQAESRFSRATADRIQAEGTLEASRATYERTIGSLPGRLVPPKEQPPIPVNRDDAAQLAAIANPTVITAQFTQLAAQDSVRLVQGELLPQVSLQGALSRADSTSIRGVTVDSAQVVAQVTVPLYESGSVYSRSRQAAETVGQRRNELDDARRQAVESATSSWETLVSVRARVKALNDQIRASEIALEGVQQEAAVGSRTVLDILDAEQELFSGRVQLVQSQRDEIVALYQLISGVGRLTAQNLGLPVEIYNPDTHYKAVRDKWFGFDPKP